MYRSVIDQSHKNLVFDLLGFGVRGFGRVLVLIRSYRFVSDLVSILNRGNS